ncbi:MAG: 50S ribosomal protein L23 [Spirochaetia bacterium]|nr:50S ribosomal protein L23 [Spirochaetia bacterium]
MNLYEVLRKPMVTEKAEVLRSSNVYAFEIDLRANKTLVKQAIKKIYGIIPRKVNIAYIKSKGKRNKFGVGFKSNRKKAYVYLDKKDKIEIFEAV